MKGCDSMKMGTVLADGYVYSKTNGWMNNGCRTHKRTVLRRRQHVKFVLGLCVCLFGFLFLLHFMTGPASDAASASHKVVSSVYIEPEDTLWSIAQEYYTKECGSMQEYVQEIKDTNGLSGDGIHAGRYLVVPYYIMD